MLGRGRPARQSTPASCYTSTHPVRGRLTHHAPRSSGYFGSDRHDVAMSTTTEWKRRPVGSPVVLCLQALLSNLSEC